MGKFTDTKYVNTIDNLVDATKNKLNNPYYTFNNQSPTRVTYYSQNIESSTLDEASGLYEQHIGEMSPFKFNKIKDFIIYGIEKISTEYDVGDSGLEAGQINGSAIILPNTVNPKPGDFFSISYVKENILFKVNGVTSDTLDNGANVYKIEYAAELTNAIENIEKQVVKNFNFIASTIGTDFKSVLQDCDYNLISELESLVEELIIYFENIFFSSNLQTFVYNHDGWRMYDPFLIEFLIRNKVLSFGSKYIYVYHATAVNKTFGMDYSKTFFKALENAGNKDINCSTIATADLITDPNSLFATRMDYYYSVRYNDNTPFKTRFSTINQDVIDKIRSNELYEKGNDKEFYNLWISYFNNNKDFIKGNIIDLIKKIDYTDNLECFYALAISIFIIEKYIEMLLK